MNALVTFHSVSSALHARALLTGQSTQCTVVPVPRSVSSSCGYALEAMDVSVRLLAETMNAAEVEWDTIYTVVLDGRNERYEAAAVFGDEERCDE